MQPDMPHLPHRLTVTPSGLHLTHLVHPPSHSTIPFMPSRTSTLTSHPPRASTCAISPTLMEHTPPPSCRLACPTPMVSPSCRLTRPPSLFAPLTCPLSCRLARPAIPVTQARGATDVAWPHLTRRSSLEVRLGSNEKKATSTAHTYRTSA